MHLHSLLQALPSLLKGEFWSCNSFCVASTTASQAGWNTVIASQGHLVRPVNIMETRTRLWSGFYFEKVKPTPIFYWAELAPAHLVVTHCNIWYYKSIQRQTCFINWLLTQPESSSDLMSLLNSTLHRCDPFGLGWIAIPKIRCRGWATFGFM